VGVAGVKHGLSRDKKSLTKIVRKGSFDEPSNSGNEYKFWLDE
jgi:hypothetical protein